MIGATGSMPRAIPRLEKDPEEWVSGDDLDDRLAEVLPRHARQRAGETLPADLTKAEASEHIDRLQGRDGG